MPTLIFRAFAGLQGPTIILDTLTFIRALVAEALEISLFMTRIQSEDNSEMEEVDMKRWTW